MIGSRRRRIGIFKKEGEFVDSSFLLTGVVVFVGYFLRIRSFYTRFTCEEGN